MFINACIRDEKSRTHRLCRAFLEEYTASRSSFTIEEVDLTKKTLSYFNKEALILRDKLIDSGETCNKMFDLARQFAGADTIIVGAPYWDLSFPAVLKVYVEHISVRNITFKNTATGVAGLCCGKKLIYITTAGGYIKNADFGTEYFKGLCGFYGILEFEAFRVEGLDIETNNPEDIMKEAEKEILSPARRI